MDIEKLATQSGFYKILNTDNKELFTLAFVEGFEASTLLQDKKLGAYAAYINGNITRAELDKALTDET